ncbi:transposase domain-containing protein [Nocardia farcinica]|uniref:transposase domain-containing protein n=1 Tax=Nocardia farcinica TaxID=37329 RepID=UPI001892F408|nr:transposase domain-containing protein [Nocardia farcinica]MBF6411448.1 transposase domain-containing protein [Nocardia farcinica]
MTYNLALYDLHYTQLRRAGRVESVSRATFRAYLLAESAGADYRTGRNARMTVASLQHATRRSESTMHRCRRLVAAFGTRTVVFGGRHRTLEERLDSWRRGDRARGWAAVAALHESATLPPVDNEHLKTLREQEFGTPPERSEGSVFLSQRKSASSIENTTMGRAPRGQDRSKRPRSVPAYDQRAVKLASSVLRDSRFPLWVHQIARGRLTAAVTRKAVAGWDVDDVFAAFEEHRIAGKRLLASPTSPAGYLTWLLRQIPDDMPPARLDRAREVAITAAEHAEWRRQLEQMRQARLNSTGMNHTAREIRDALANRTRGNAAERARAAAQARRELARAMRGH